MTASYSLLSNQNWISVTTTPRPSCLPICGGAGTTLIERGFAHELSGQATIQFETQGVHAILRAPTARALSQGSPIGSKTH
jgi:hypothetical protein